MPPFQPLELVNGMNVNIPHKLEKIGLIYHKAQKEPILWEGLMKGVWEIKKNLTNLSDFSIIFDIIP